MYCKEVGTMYQYHSINKVCASREAKVDVTVSKTVVFLLLSAGLMRDDRDIVGRTLSLS